MNYEEPWRTHNSSLLNWIQWHNWRFCAATRCQWIVRQWRLWGIAAFFCKKKSELVDNDWHQVIIGSLPKQWVIYNPKLHILGVCQTQQLKFFSVQLCEFGLSEVQAPLGVDQICSELVFAFWASQKGLSFGFPSGYPTSHISYTHII